MELDFCGFQIKIALNFKSQGTEKLELFSQGAYNFQNLRIETRVIADYEYAKIFSFAMFDGENKKMFCINLALSDE